MPIFEYKCKNCGNVFEEYVKKYDDKVNCPKCKMPSERNYSGKMYSQTGKTQIHCTGNCSTCSGCK